MIQSTTLKRHVKHPRDQEEYPKTYTQMENRERARNPKKTHEMKKKAPNGPNIDLAKEKKRGAESINASHS